MALVETVDGVQYQNQDCAWDIVINAGETLDVTVNGFVFSVPFNTDADTTIDDFVTAHQAALQAISLDVSNARW